MAGLIKKVKSGEPLAISAPTFNTIVDAVQDWQTRQRNLARQSRPAPLPPDVVLIRNDSGEYRAQYDVLGISGMVLKPVDSVPLFAESLAFTGATPAQEHAGRFVVLLEPLPQDQVGRACINGICVVRVRMVSEDHTYAEVKPNDLARLESASTGSVRLLWIEPATDRDPDATVAWCVVRLGMRAGGGGSQAMARVTSKAGTSPPYAYSAVEVEENGPSPGVPAFVEVSGGVRMAGNLWNLAELGELGSGVAALPEGTYVRFWPANESATKYLCEVSNYRGSW